MEVILELKHSWHCMSLGEAAFTPSVYWEIIPQCVKWFYSAFPALKGEEESDS